MIFLTYIPHQPLADLVELLWYCDGFVPQHSKERVLPTGTVQLIISLLDDPFRTYDPHDTDQVQSYRGPLVCGPRSECSVIDKGETHAFQPTHVRDHRPSTRRMVALPRGR